MLSAKNGRVLPCVLVDLNTQCDFFDPRGSCRVHNADEIHRNLRRAVAWAKRNQVPVISSMASRRLFDAGRNGRGVYCVEGSRGHSKLPFTLFPNRVFIPGDNTLAVSIDLFRSRQQVIFPQRTPDLFSNPKADRFLTNLKTEEFILLGAVIEYAVKAVALGLLVRGRRVTIVPDCCGSWMSSEADLSIRQMHAKGAELLTIDELLARRLPRRWRYTVDGRVEAFPINGSLPCATGLGGNGHGNNGQSRPMGLRQP